MKHPHNITMFLTLISILVTVGSLENDPKLYTIILAWHVCH
jgi:hypothetical protein